MEVDIVTQIQERLDQLSVGLFSTIGALQRDAQPTSIRGEPSPTLPNSANSQQLSKQWADEVMALSKAVDELIDKLPEVDSTEYEELSQTVKAMKSNEDTGQVLRKETAITEDLLVQVRSMHAALADAELERRYARWAESERS